MFEDESDRRGNSYKRVGIGLMVFGVLMLSGLAAACGGTATPSAPTAAALATQPVATTGAALAPTVAAVATAAAPTVAAAETRVAPTVAAVATAVAPTVSAAATAPATAVAIAEATAAALATRAAPTISAAATALAPTAEAAATTSALSAGTATATTAGQLADAGQQVYASNCAGCHGPEGQGKVGPALIGPSASFKTFNSAQGLFTFISSTMPKTHPGTLSPEQYLQVTAYLLVQNGIVTRDASLSNASLSDIQLKK